MSGFSYYIVLIKRYFNLQLKCFDKDGNNGIAKLQSEFASILTNHDWSIIVESKAPSGAVAYIINTRKLTS